MTRTMTILMVCLGAMPPVAASAQQADATYCAALGQTYERYVGDNAQRDRGVQRNATVTTAITKCKTDSASAIPVIEKALHDAKVALPPRG